MNKFVKIAVALTAAHALSGCAGYAVVSTASQIAGAAAPVRVLTEAASNVADYDLSGTRWYVLRETPGAPVAGLSLQLYTPYRGGGWYAVRLFCEAPAGDARLVMLNRPAQYFTAQTWEPVGYAKQDEPAVRAFCAVAKPHGHRDLLIYSIKLNRPQYEAAPVTGSSPI